MLLTRYCSGDKMEKYEIGLACSPFGGGRGVYRVLMGTREGKRPLGRPKHSWEGNIKWILKELVGEAWTGFTWLRIGTGGGRL